MKIRDFLFRHIRFIAWLLLIATYFNFSESKCNYFDLDNFTSILIMIVLPVSIYALIISLNKEKLILALIGLLSLINIILLLTGCWQIMV